MKQHPLDPNLLSNRDKSPQISRRELYEMKRKDMEEDGDISERK
jgi:hypothetical protein